MKPSRNEFAQIWLNTLLATSPLEQHHKIEKKTPDLAFQGGLLLYVM